MLHQYRYFCRLICFSFALLTLLVSSTLLLDYLFGTLIQLRLFPEKTPMLFNTALLYCALSIACLLSLKSRSPLIGALLAAIAIIPILTLLQYALERDFGVDQLLYTMPPTPNTPFTGRMAPSSAWGLILLSASLAPRLFTLNSKSATLSANILTAIPFSVALLALLAYLFSFIPAHTLEDTTQISAITAFLIVLLSSAIVLLYEAEAREEDSALVGAPFFLAIFLIVINYDALHWMREFFKVQNAQDLASSEFNLFSRFRYLSALLLIEFLTLLFVLAVLYFRSREQRQLLRFTNSQLNAIFKASLESIITVDERGWIRFANPSSVCVLGHNLNEILECHIFRFLKLSNPAALEDVLSGRVPFVKSQEILHRSDGTQIFVEFSCGPLKTNDRIEGAVIMLHDTSRAVLYEKKLLELIEKMRRKTTELKQAQKNFEVALAEKLEYLDKVSNELRGPLKTLVGINATSSGGGVQIDLLRQPADELAGIINRTTKEAQAHPEQPKVKLRSFDLHSTLSKTLSDFSMEAAAGKNQTILEIEALPKDVVGDPDLFQDLLGKILQNALHSTESGKIVVSGKLLSEDETAMVVKLTITDTGKGIEEAKLALLQEMLSRPDGSVSKRYADLGGGLRRAKRIADILDIEITLQSLPGTGTTVELKIPFEKTFSDHLEAGRI